MSIKVTIHGSGSGSCSLTGKNGEGLTVTFEDGTVKESFLSWRAFRQLLGLKTGQNGKPETKPPVAPSLPAVASGKP